MKVNIEMFGYIDNNGLKHILDSDPNLKAYVDQEMDRMTDEGIIKNCPGCGGCPSSGKCPSKDGCPSGDGCGHGGCGKHDDSGKTAYEAQGASYLCCAASCILDYYLPPHVKEILHLNSALSLEEC